MNASKEKEMKERSKESKVKEIPPPPQRARARDLGGLDPTLAGIGGPTWNRGITPDDLKDAADKIGMPYEEVNEWIRYREVIGWFYQQTGNPINFRNFRASLRMWHRMKPEVEAAQARAKEREARRNSTVSNAYEEQKVREAAKREQAATKDESWALCAERCANYRADGTGCNRCKQGFKVPPPVRERPCPPESCVMFVRIEEGGAV